MIRFAPWRALVASIVLLTALTACGGAATSAAPEPAGGGGFPVTITHKFGQTTIPAAPKRVVSLGYTDQDAILALGVVPVAVREFTGNQPSATWPWAADKLAGRQPKVLQAGDINPEAIAALAPDLIVAVSAGLTQEQYATFSRIAPVVSQPAQYVDYGTPWQDATRLIGQALGKTAEADTLVADLEAKIAAVKVKYPQLAGKTIAGARPSTSDNAGYFVWGPQDLRARFFSSLGMAVPPQFAQLSGDSFYATISTEQLALLDSADVVALITANQTERTAFQSLPGYAALRVVGQKKVITFDDEQSAALSFSSVLSLPALVDTVPAQLAAIVSGQNAAGGS